MNTQHENNNEKGFFKLLEGDKQAGLMEYRWIDESRFNIEHTEVSEEFQGQGLAKKLLTAAVDYAHSENKKVSATCDYARKALESNSDYADIYRVR